MPSIPHDSKDMACPVSYIYKCLFHRRSRHYFWISLFLMYMVVVYRTHLKNRNPELENVVVHIDLKGAPPKMKYLVSLLKVLKHYGANALLIEYEDTFPYSGILSSLRSDKHSYNAGELTDFLIKANEEGFQIIPLVQTFGHLEYVLKHEKWMNLRENPKFSDSICPTRPESHELIQNMLKQVIEFHENVAPLQYLHIGCDEVHHLNECISCREKEETNLTMFKNHVSKVVDIAHGIKSRLKILIWDDMLRGVKPEFLEPIRLDIEPVSWHYGSTVEAKVSDLYKYHENFKRIWIASAYKGADGESRMFPELSERFRNHYSWMQLLRRYTRLHYNFKGIILTGWSRYHHNAPLCELMIPAIPSLVTNLIVVQMYKKDKYDDYFLSWQDFFANNIKYDLMGNLACKIDDSFLIKDDLDCSYPGRNINNALIAFKFMDIGISRFISSFNKMSNLNNYSFPISQFQNILFQGELLKSQLDSIKNDLWKSLTEFYPDSVAAEYVEQNTMQLKNKIDKVLIDSYAYKNKYMKLTRNITLLNN